MPGATGEEIFFVALSDGSLVVEPGSSDLDPSPFALALELPRPYRAGAVRRTGETWAVGARRIHVVELSKPPAGDEVEIAWDGRERSVRIDGEPTLDPMTELEQLGSTRAGGWVVRGRRLRGRFWEVDVEAL